MHNEPLHTRFRIAPSGDVHMGHAILAWLSMQAARVTGGTFTMRTQQIWATRTAVDWAKFQEHAHRNLDELILLGIEPSDAHAFLAHDMSPSWRVQFTDDRALIDHYWHKLGFDKLWPWEPSENVCTADAPSRRIRWSAPGLAHHPYMRFAQIVGEVTTGRNCIIRGMDHLREADFNDYVMHLVAKEHYGLAEFDRGAQYAPVQYFLPFITSDGAAKLASSDVVRTKGFFVKDVLEADVPPEKLFLYMGKVLWGSTEQAERAWTDWSTEPVVKSVPPDSKPVQAGVHQLFAAMVANPTIDREDWTRFLHTGEVE